MNQQICQVHAKFPNEASVVARPHASKKETHIQRGHAYVVCHACTRPCTPSRVAEPCADCHPTTVTRAAGTALARTTATHALDPTMEPRAHPLRPPSSHRLEARHSRRHQSTLRARRRSHARATRARRAHTSSTDRTHHMQISQSSERAHQPGRAAIATRAQRRAPPPLLQRGRARPTRPPTSASTHPTHRCGDGDQPPRPPRSTQ